jgi:serine/threonine-protein kinase RsbW
MHTPATSTSASRTVTKLYPGTTKHIRAVRSDLRALLADRPAADDVISCASELATNAVRHSRSCLPGGTFTVQVTVIPGICVRFHIEDGGGPWTRALADPDRHHGFDIVGALAAEWAIEGDDSGRTASAVLSWAPLPE